MYALLFLLAFPSFDAGLQFAFPFLFLACFFVFLILLLFLLLLNCTGSQVSDLNITVLGRHIYIDILEDRIHGSFLEIESQF